MPLETWGTAVLGFYCVASVVSSFFGARLFSAFALDFAAAPATMSAPPENRPDAMLRTRFRNDRRSVVSEPVAERIVKHAMIEMNDKHTAQIRALGAFFTTSPNLISLLSFR